MHLNEPKNQVPFQKESTEAPPITPAEHRAIRQKDAEATEMAENIVRGLNEAVRKGELHGL